jgi:hypothetical protein
MPSRLDTNRIRASDNTLRSHDSYYLEWFRRKFPYIKLPSHDENHLCMQTQTSWQGTKDASWSWYRLVRSVFEESGWNVCQADKGIFTKACDDGSRALACLSTDDVLLFAKCCEVYLWLKQHFMKYFKVTSAEGPILRYLNMRIVISLQGISIDQMDYIQGILHEYGLGPDDDVPKVKGPFLTDPKFEVELFNSLPLDANEHKPYVEKHKGTLAKWTGALMHPQV